MLTMTSQRVGLAEGVRRGSGSTRAAAAQGGKREARRGSGGGQEGVKRGSGNTRAAAARGGKREEATLGLRRAGRSLRRGCSISRRKPRSKRKVGSGVSFTTSSSFTTFDPGPNPPPARRRARSIAPDTD
eukprot:1177982-Prorocentrum_minimum.AAC.5